MLFWRNAIPFFDDGERGVRASEGDISLLIRGPQTRRTWIMSVPPLI